MSTTLQYLINANHLPIEKLKLIAGSKGINNVITGSSIRL